MWSFLLLGLSHAYLVPTGMINVSTPLTSSATHLRVAFFDFDKTLTIGSTSAILNLCDPSGNCGTYTPNASCTCNQTTTALGQFLLTNISDRVLAEGDIFFNGTDRRDRIAATFASLQSMGIELKVVSTASFAQNAANWQYYISKVFDVANLTQYIALGDILTLDDPGLNIPADKGTLIAAYLASKNWTMHNGLFADDSGKNINTANGKVDWLQVTPAAGLTLNQLVWIETRAAQTFAVNCSSLMSPSFGGVGSCTTDKMTADNCSITCDSGYMVSGPATQLCVAGTRAWNAVFQGSQSCMAAKCPDLVVANGTAGTCKNLTTGQNCSITCNTSFTIMGPSVQTCVGASNGTSAFANSQICVANPPACPNADLTVFLSACSDAELSGTCRDSCATRARSLLAAFKLVGGTPDYVEACIRNAVATASTPLSNTTTNYVVTQSKAGNSICREVSGATSPSVFLASFVTVVVSLCLMPW